MSTPSQSTVPTGEPATAPEALDNPAAAAPSAPIQAPAQGPMEELAAATAAFAETFHRWSSRKAIEAGANVTRLRLLHLVSCHGPQKMAELADRLDVTPRSVTALVDGLETEGLVRRAHHATDRRVLLVELTCNPDRVQSQMLTYQASLAGLLAELSETEREVMLRALVRLRDRMHAETMVPAPRQIREPETAEPQTGRMPALYLGHGAPTLLEDALWPSELADWAAALPHPKAILVVSAHWQSAPLTIGATAPVPLVYDFYGFPERYYQVRYDSPGAPDLAERVAALMPPGQPVIQRNRGLDHGAYIPLIAMYPRADVPVLQMSMPDLDPEHLFDIGRRLAPLRDEGVLIMGSGFLTHGVPFIHQYWDGRPGAPEWSKDFDMWAADRLAQGDLDALFDFRNLAPGMPYAHPTVEHFAPLFVTLGAATDPAAAPDTKIEGYWLGLAKRSFQVR